MKARTNIVRMQDIEREVKKEFERISKAHDSAQASYYANQTLALVFFELAKTYGWGTKRMQRLLNGINSSQSLLEEESLNADDILKYIKQKYKIDLMENNRIEVRYLD